MAPAMDHNVVELPVLEETQTELQVVEEDHTKNIQPLQLPRATARTWTTCSPESALWSSECLLPAL